MTLTIKMQAPDPKHLKWLVESRKQNQQVSARLYELITPKFPKKERLGYDAKTLIGMGFSLWRAAFLADKSGKLKETNEDAAYFLGEMLETNAIAFAQDKKAKGFTFNYYLANARFRLAEYVEDNRGFKVEQRLLKKGKLGGMPLKDRWRAFQRAFENAVSHFEGRLKNSN